MVNDISLETFEPTSVDPGIVSTAIAPVPSQNPADYLNIQLTADEEALVKTIVGENLQRCAIHDRVDAGAFFSAR